jgi:hypothetical protein
MIELVPVIEEYVDEGIRLRVSFKLKNSISGTAFVQDSKLAKEKNKIVLINFKYNLCPIFFKIFHP